ncbi:MAG: hypothetical protein KatS3mg097_230 [Candidatus Parcubacteria bacterium]|nr:MAG: hypothetical protein KatS3mg097_230 [Candidatus Parcubacteria bacterium]
METVKTIITVIGKTTLLIFLLLFLFYYWLNKLINKIIRG